MMVQIEDGAWECPLLEKGNRQLRHAFECACRKVEGNETSSSECLLLGQAGVRNLEALFAILIGTMAASFGVMYVLAGVPTASVVEGALCSQAPLACCTTGFSCCLRVTVPLGRLCG